MHLMLQRCDNCQNASYDPMFFRGGARIEFNNTGERMEVCGACVNQMAGRLNMYRLRDEVANPVMTNDEWLAVHPPVEQNVDPERYT